MSRTYRRYKKNLFLKREFQGKLIFNSFLLSILGVTIFAVIFSLLSADYLTISYENQYLRINRTPQILLVEMFRAHWIFILTVGSLISVLALVVTHRIAGPLYRLEKTFDTMLARDLSDNIHLRNKDVGQDLAEKINSFSEQLADDFTQMREECDQLANSLQQLQGEEKEATQRILNQLQQQINSYKLP